MQGSSKSVSTTPVPSFDKSGKFYAAPSHDSHQRQAPPDSYKYQRRATRQEDEEQDSLAYSLSPSGSGANQHHCPPFKTSSRRAMTDSPPPPPTEPLRRLVASCWKAGGGGDPGDGTGATATVNWGEITQGAPSSGSYNYGEHYDVEDVGDGKLAAGEFSIMAEKIYSELAANPKRPKTAVPPPASPIVFTNTKATTTGDYIMPTDVAAEDQHHVTRDVGTSFPSLRDSQGPTIQHHTEPHDQLFEMVKAAALQQHQPVKNVCDTSMEEEDDELVGMNDTHEAAATKTTTCGGSLTPLTASITPSPDIIRMQISPKKTPVNDDFMQISPKKTPPSSGKNFFRTGVPTGLRTIAERAFPRPLEDSSLTFPRAPAIPMEEFGDNIDAACRRRRRRICLFLRRDASRRGRLRGAARVVVGSLSRCARAAGSLGQRLARSAKILPARPARLLAVAAAAAAAAAAAVVVVATATTTWSLRNRTRNCTVRHRLLTILCSTRDNMLRPLHPATLSRIVAPQYLPVSRRAAATTARASTRSSIRKPLGFEVPIHFTEPIHIATYSTFLWLDWIETLFAWMVVFSTSKRLPQFTHQPQLIYTYL